MRTDKVQGGSVWSDVLPIWLAKKAVSAVWNGVQVAVALPQQLVQSARNFAQDVNNHIFTAKMSVVSHGNTTVRANFERLGVSLEIVSRPPAGFATKDQPLQTVIAYGRAEVDHIVQLFATLLHSDNPNLQELVILGRRFEAEQWFADEFERLVKACQTDYDNGVNRLLP